MPTKKKTIRRRRRKRQPTQYSGVVTLDLMSPGSKSERMAVQLDLGKEKVLLRRPGIRSYRDKTLEELVGKRINVKGFKRGNRLYLKNWELVAGEEHDENQAG